MSLTQSVMHTQIGFAILFQPLLQVGDSFFIIFDDPHNEIAVKGRNYYWPLLKVTEGGGIRLCHFHRKEAGSIGAFPYEVLTCEKHSASRSSFSHFAVLNSGRNRTVPNIAGDFGERFLLFLTD